MIERAQREQFQSGASFMVVVYDPQKELPRIGMDLLVAVPTVSNISSSQRCKRKKQVVTVTKCKRFCKLFPKVCLQGGNGVYEGMMTLPTSHQSNTITLLLYQSGPRLLVKHFFNHSGQHTCTRKHCPNPLPQTLLKNCRT